MAQSHFIMHRSPFFPCLKLGCPNRQSYCFSVVTIFRSAGVVTTSAAPSAITAVIAVIIERSNLGDGAAANVSRRSSGACVTSGRLSAFSDYGARAAPHRASNRTATGRRAVSQHPTRRSADGSDTGADDRSGRRRRAEPYGMGIGGGATGRRPKRQPVVQKPMEASQDPIFRRRDLPELGWPP